jgi:hypothetical protein
MSAVLALRLHTKYPLDPSRFLLTQPLTCKTGAVFEMREAQADLSRLGGAGEDSRWRSCSNADGALSPVYPPVVAVPSTLTDEKAAGVSV